jgi:hypothetical protein
VVISLSTPGEGDTSGSQPAPCETITILSDIYALGSCHFRMNRAEIEREPRLKISSIPTRVHIGEILLSNLTNLRKSRDASDMMDSRVRLFDSRYKTRILIRSTPSCACWRSPIKYALKHVRHISRSLREESRETRCKPGRSSFTVFLAIARGVSTRLSVASERGKKWKKNRSARLSAIPLAGKVASEEEIKRNGGYKEERFIAGLLKAA